MARAKSHDAANDPKPVDQPGATATSAPEQEKAADAVAPDATDRPETAQLDDGKTPDGKIAADGRTMDISFPPPEDVPGWLLEGAQLVVKATTSKGRWRAGRKFTRDQETLIPLSGVTGDQQQALVADPMLVVKLRLVKPD